MVVARPGPARAMVGKKKVKGKSHPNYHGRFQDECRILRRGPAANGQVEAGVGIRIGERRARAQLGEECRYFIDTLSLGRLVEPT